MQHWERNSIRDYKERGLRDAREALVDSLNEPAVSSSNDGATLAGPFVLSHPISFWSRDIEAYSMGGCATTVEVSIGYGGRAKDVHIMCNALPVATNCVVSVHFRTGGMIVVKVPCDSASKPVVKVIEGQFIIMRGNIIVDGEVPLHD
jgi:hypothetical protein